MIVYFCLLVLTVTSSSILEPKYSSGNLRQESLQQQLAGALIAAEWFYVSGPLSDIFLENQKGNCTLLYSSRSLREISQQPPYQHTANKLTILFYDPIYANKGMIHIQLQLKGFFDKQKDMWIGNSTSKTNVYVQGARTKQIFLPIQFSIAKNQTNINLNGVNLKILALSVKKYDWIPCIIMVCELLAILLMQFTSVDRISTVSTVSVVLTMVNQLSLSFVYIYLSFNISPEYSIVMLFSGAFTMACFLRVLQKYHKLLEIENKWQKFMCILLVSYIYCHLLFFSAEIFNLVNCFTILPQIFKNIISKLKKITNSFHLILLFSLNSIFPIYLHFSQDNIFKISPNRSIGIVISLFVILQILVLTLQYCFKRYKICRISCFSKNVKNQVIVCSICLLEADYCDIVTTPCQHQFHEKCLVKWLRYKRICPMDRKKLSINDIY